MACSDGMLALFGIERRNLDRSCDDFGTALASAIHPDDRRAFEAALPRSVGALQQRVSEFRVIGTDGSVRRLRAEWGDIARSMEGVPLAILAYLHDDTARRVEDRARSAERAQLANACRLAKLGPWTFFADQRSFEFTDEFYAMLHTSAEREGGYRMSAEEYARRFVYEEDAPLVGIEIAKAIEGSDPNCSYHVEHRIRYADGGIGFIAVRYFIVLDETGRVERTIGVNQDITERVMAEKRVKAALAERETLLRELYHRTKNNLQVLVALLRMQAGEYGDPRLVKAYKAMEERVLSLSLVHMKLCESENLSMIDIGEYASELASSLARGSDAREKVLVKTEVSRVNAGIEVATPFGLALSELITNSLKHAFPGELSGTIALNLRSEGGEVVAELTDNGMGLPDGFDPREDGKMGFKNAFALIEGQLQGSLRVESGRGVRCVIRFPSKG
jgi:two-component sensor histidine kinase/PAS domain-containing protein